MSVYRIHAEDDGVVLRWNCKRVLSTEDEAKKVAEEIAGEPLSWKTFDGKDETWLTGFKHGA